jgi:UDP-3-O-[3-hydroxymyristoyl] N-acetylglucosamine deacetylase
MREGDKFIGVYPAGQYSVSYAINFPHPLIGSEVLKVELTNGGFVEQIASARTFGFLEQQRAMLNMGLIRGATRESCIVLTAEGIDNPPLRYADEFVRHKILDLIGDLALFGKRILGYVQADRAGHAMHTAIVSRILRDQSYWKEVTLEEYGQEQAAVEHLSVTD